MIAENTPIQSDNEPLEKLISCIERTESFNKYSVAEFLYSTYCEAVGGKAFNGLPLPSWKEFYDDVTKSAQVRAWMKTADKAMELMRVQIP